MEWLTPLSDSNHKSSSKDKDHKVNYRTLFFLHFIKVTAQVWERVSLIMCPVYPPLGYGVMWCLPPGKPLACSPVWAKVPTSASLNALTCHTLMEAARLLWLHARYHSHANDRWHSGSPFALQTGTWSWLCPHTSQELPVNGEQSISDFKAFHLPRVSQLVSWPLARTQIACQFPHCPWAEIHNRWASVVTGWDNLHSPP